MIAALGEEAVEIDIEGERAWMLVCGHPRTGLVQTGQCCAAAPGILFRG